MKKTGFYIIFTLLLQCAFLGITYKLYHSFESVVVAGIILILMMLNAIRINQK